MIINKINQKWSEWHIGVIFYFFLPFFWRFVIFFGEAAGLIRNGRRVRNGRVRRGRMRGRRRMRRWRWIIIGRILVLLLFFVTSPSFLSRWTWRKWRRSQDGRAHFSLLNFFCFFFCRSSFNFPLPLFNFLLFFFFFFQFA